MDLHTTCKEYDFCTPETRAELAANGFDFSVCKFGITEFIAGRVKTGFIVETKGVIPYPTFTEVLRLLPNEIKPKDRTSTYHLGITKKEIGFVNDIDNVYRFSLNYDRFKVNELNGNETEAVCLLWLQLKKGGFLNG